MRLIARPLATVDAMWKGAGASKVGGGPLTIQFSSLFCRLLCRSIAAIVDNFVWTKFVGLVQTNLASLAASVNKQYKTLISWSCLLNNACGQLSVADKLSSSLANKRVGGKADSWQCRVSCGRCTQLTADSWLFRDNKIQLSSAQLSSAQFSLAQLTVVSLCELQTQVSP